jgi:GTPase SAR1 family protein
MVKIGRISDDSLGYANILVFGESGSGKTHFAGTYNPETTLYVNIVAESGAMTLRSQGIDMDKVDIQGYTEMVELIKWLYDNGSKYDLIYVDSLSQWQKLLESEIPETSNKFAKWQTVKEYTKDVIAEFKKLPFHTVFTCEIIKDKDEESGSVLYIPSLSGSSKHEISYWFDEVYYFTRFQADLKSPIQYKALTASAMKYPCKSRLGMQRELENPNLSEIIAKAGFRKIDKGTQAKELEKARTEANNLISEQQLNVLRDLLAKKEVDQFKFLEHYQASSLPAFPANRYSDAVTALNSLANKAKK